MKKCKQCLRIKTTVRERRYNIVYEERKKKQPDTHKCEQQHKKKPSEWLEKKSHFFSSKNYKRHEKMHRFYAWNGKKGEKRLNSQQQTRIDQLHAIYIIRIKRRIYWIECITIIMICTQRYCGNNDSIDGIINTMRICVVRYWTIYDCT